MKKFDEERLREEYTPKKKSAISEAIKLDKKVKLPVHIFAYSYGILGSLILGVGMCLAMEVLASGTFFMILGIIIGLVGIAMISTNYPIYKVYLRNRKEKYASQIILILNNGNKE